MTISQNKKKAIVGRVSLASLVLVIGQLIVPLRGIDFSRRLQDGTAPYFVPLPVVFAVCVLVIAVSGVEAVGLLAKAGTLYRDGRARRTGFPQGFVDGVIDFFVSRSLGFNYGYIGAILGSIFGAVAALFLLTAATHGDGLASIFWIYVEFLGLIVGTVLGIVVALWLLGRVRRNAGNRQRERQDLLLVNRLIVVAMALIAAMFWGTLQIWTHAEDEMSTGSSSSSTVWQNPIKVV